MVPPPSCAGGGLGEGASLLSPQGSIGLYTSFLGFGGATNRGRWSAISRSMVSGAWSPATRRADPPHPQPGRRHPLEFFAIDHADVEVVEASGQGGGLDAEGPESGGGLAEPGAGEFQWEATEFAVVGLSRGLEYVSVFGRGGERAAPDEQGVAEESGERSEADSGFAGASSVAVEEIVLELVGPHVCREFENGVSEGSRDNILRMKSWSSGITSSRKSCPTLYYPKMLNGLALPSQENNTPSPGGSGEPTRRFACPPPPKRCKTI